MYRIASGRGSGNWSAVVTFRVPASRAASTTGWHLCRYTAQRGSRSPLSWRGTMQSAYGSPDAERNSASSTVSGSAGISQATIKLSTAEVEPSAASMPASGPCPGKRSGTTGSPRSAYRKGFPTRVMEAHTPRARSATLSASALPAESARALSVPIRLLRPPTRIHAARVGWGAIGLPKC